LRPGRDNVAAVDMAFERIAAPSLRLGQRLTALKPRHGCLHFEQGRIS